MNEKKCESCGTQFQPYRSYQQFCSRKCFRRKYYGYGEKKEDVFPIYACFICRFRIQLEFSPKKDAKKWEDFICPNCKQPHTQR